MNSSLSDPIPPSMRVSPKQLIDNAWILSLGIMSAEKELLIHDFISKTSKLANNRSIVVGYIDFSQFASPIEAWNAAENKTFREIVESDSAKPSLLWFDNCDSLAPLECDLTFSIRSKLTTRTDNHIQSVFIASKQSIDLLFRNYSAAFYRANFKITG